MTPSGEQTGSWRQRLHALKNMPPILKLAWSTAPGQFVAGGLLRLASALVPVAMLWIGKLIIDRIVEAVKQSGSVPKDMWLLLGAEFLLALSSNLIWRSIDYFDVRLTDQFTRAISLRIMDHASRLDLQSFEDPVFYDKLERARVQATDRTVMLRSLGQLLQQAVTFATMAAAIVAYSPLLLLVIVVSVVPSFIGESYFAFLGYDLAHGLTPVRRQMDYLRILGSSKESAKELRVFGLGH
jgi:ATP-binding cassette subfamily B protein